MIVYSSGVWRVGVAHYILNYDICVSEYRPYFIVAA